MTQDHYKSYDDKRRRPLKFEVGHHVFLKVLPTKSVVRFGVRGKLNPWYIGPYEVLERIELVAHQLALSLVCQECTMSSICLNSESVYQMLTL